MIDAISTIESLKNSLDALQAAYEVSLRAERIALQRAAGLDRRKLGAGVADEIALARGMSPSRAGNQHSLRQVIVETLPRTWQRMAEGAVSGWAAEQVASAVLVLDDDDRGVVDRELAPTLHELSPLTAGRRARVRADALDQQAALARIRRNESQRHVSQRPAAPGMMRLSALLPLHQGVAAFASLSAEADSARARGDERSRGQAMADALVERLTGQPGAIEPIEVQLLMTDRTLLAGADDAAELNGHPIPGAVARHLVLTGHSLPGARQHRCESDPGDHTQDRHAEPDELQDQDELLATRWVRRLYADPVTGALEAMDGRKRLFTGSMRRFVLARDRRCRTPGCEAAPRVIDHVERYSDGGSTTPGNGAAVCERFNYVAELPGWSTTVDPASGVLSITTPTGHVHRSPIPSQWDHVGLSAGAGQPEGMGLPSGAVRSEEAGPPGRDDRPDGSGLPGGAGPPDGPVP